MQVHAWEIIDGAQFAWGIVWGLIDLNNLDEIQQCGLEGYDVGHNVQNYIWKNYKAGRLGQAFVDFLLEEERLCINVVPDCRQTGDEIVAAWDWAQIFRDKNKLVAKVTRNFVFHRKAVMEDIQIMKNEYAMEDWPFF